jgi:hypothetical protein
MWCFACRGDCQPDVHVQIETCDNGDYDQRIVYRIAGGGDIRISPWTRPDLCVERIYNDDMKLKPCDSNNSNQRLSGLKISGQRSELSVKGVAAKLVSQDHDPKHGEKLKLVDSRTARDDHTNYWQVINRSVTSSPPGPPPPSSSTCSQFLGLHDHDIIRSGQQIYINGNSNLKLEHWINGNLAVRDNGRVIWESYRNNPQGNYWTQLQGDGNMITRPGHPDDIPKEMSIWKSRSTSQSNIDYFFGLDCSKRYVAIYRGKPDRPDGEVWRENTKV